MATEAGRIKEFLVSLGFTVDESSFRKFNGGIDSATKNVFKVAAAATAAMAAVELFVSRTAENMDKLYFSSKRTGASVQEIQSFSYAVKQLGGSAEGAANAIEGIAAFQRNNPGGGGILQSMFGVKPEHLKDAEKTLRDMLPTLNAMPFWQAKSMVQGLGLGIDDNTLMAMRNGDFVRNLEHVGELYKSIGTDQDKIAADNRVYQQSVADTNVVWQQISWLMENKLIGFMGEINKFSIEFAQNLAKGKGVLDAVPTKGGDFSQYKSWGDFIDKRGLGGALWDMLKEGGKDLVEGGKTDIKVAKYALGSNSLHSSVQSWLFGQYDEAMTEKENDRKNRAAILGSVQRESNGNPKAVGDHGTSFGVGQWHGDRATGADRWLRAKFGRGLNDTSFGEQMQYLMYDLFEGPHKNVGQAMNRVNGLSAKSAIFTKGYENPANLTAETAIRERYANDIYKTMSPTINQTNNVTVSGNNPREVGAAVKDSLYPLTTGLVSKMKTAVQ